MKGRFGGILLWLGFIAVACYLTWPWFLDSLLGIEYVTTIGAYEAKVAALSGGDLESAWEAARTYNEEIRKMQARRPFSYLGAEATDSVYESLLRFGEDNTLGSVRVPAAGINLPVAHGTTNAVLDIEAGHLYGTSLPVGGDGTHAVIAGHTGLRNADIFTGLSKVREGDVFYIQVLDRELAYRISRIRVVLPEDEDPFLQVEAGRDLVTLYTCTPYGVNSHRLLVTGERDTSLENPANAPSEGSTGLAHVSRDIGAVVKCVGFGMIPVLTAVLSGLFLFGGRGRRRKRTRLQ